MDKWKEIQQTDNFFHPPFWHDVSLLVECSFSCPALGWSLPGSSLVSAKPLLSPTVTRPSLRDRAYPPLASSLVFSISCNTLLSSLDAIC